LNAKIFPFLAQQSNDSDFILKLNKNETTKGFKPFQGQKHVVQHNTN